MNQSKFSLADLITLLAAFAFGFICFLGANFYTLGDTKQSIVLAVIISVLLSITALGAKWLKRTKSNFKTCFIFEIVLLVLFTGLTAYFTYSSFSHYFVVSEQKTKIQSDLNTSIKQAENMFSEYEDYANKREAGYKLQLVAAIQNKNTNHITFNEFGFKRAEEVPFDKQIAIKMEGVREDLFPESFKNLKNSDSIWFAEAKEVAGNWKPISVVEVLKNIEQKAKYSLKELEKLSVKPIKFENKPITKFKVDFTFPNLKKYFTTLGKPNSLSISLAFVAYLLMLLSYLISKRSTKTFIGTTKDTGTFDVKY